MIKLKLNTLYVCKTKKIAEWFLKVTGKRWEMRGEQKSWETYKENYGVMFRIDNTCGFRFRVNDINHISFRGAKTIDVEPFYEIAQSLEFNKIDFDYDDFFEFSECDNCERKKSKYYQESTCMCAGCEQYNGNLVSSTMTSIK